MRLQHRRKHICFFGFKQSLWRAVTSDECTSADVALEHRCAHDLLLKRVLTRNLRDQLTAESISRVSSVAEACVLELSGGGFTVISTSGDQAALL